jgi:hypothetical protein
MICDENGLTGNSGIVPGGHLGMNYSAGEGNVFVATKDWWKRVTANEVQDGDVIVTCYYCDKPAISIDHHYPYETEFNYCEDHKFDSEKHDKEKAIYNSGVRDGRAALLRRS